jgi:hypothetical protein
MAYKKETVVFLDWFADQFDAGAVHQSNYRECASYLQGLRDAMTSELSDEAIQRIIRCETVLLAAASMVDWARREKATISINRKIEE